MFQLIDDLKSFQVNTYYVLINKINTKNKNNKKYLKIENLKKQIESLKKRYVAPFNFIKKFLLNFNEYKVLNT